MGKYDGLIHSKINFNGVEYYYNIFSKNIFIDYDGKMLKDKYLINIINKKIEFINKLNHLIFKINLIIEQKKINYFKKKFPINSVILYKNERYIVENVISNFFSSSEHNSNYNLNRHYFIIPTTKNKNLYKIPVDDCISLNELRLKKLKMIL